MEGSQPAAEATLVWKGCEWVSTSAKGFGRRWCNLSGESHLKVAIGAVVIASSSAIFIKTLIETRRCDTNLLNSAAIGVFIVADELYSSEKVKTN